MNAGPKLLVKEFHDNPGTKLITKDGNWMYLWGGGVKIDGEFYEHSDVIKRIEELSEK